MCTVHDNNPDADRSDIDCDQGEHSVVRCSAAAAGRLEPDERMPAENGWRKRLHGQGSDGYCIHFDRERGICRIWEQRPKICRSYSCNTDRCCRLRCVIRSAISLTARVRRAP